MSLLIESFVFGAANSVHCACMCGPLSVAFGGSAAATAGYHSGRVASYSAVGVALGGTGTLLGSSRIGVPTAVVASVLAVGLVVLATFGERGAVRVPFLSQLAQRAMAAGRRLRPAQRAAVLGLCTPLLPCGLLWSACAGAAVAGSALAGATVMAGFALGAVPVLAFVQQRAPALARRFSPQTLAWVQRGAMLTAAAVLAWRAWAAVQGGSCH